jgi:hypothetical protein
MVAESQVMIEPLAGVDQVNQNIGSALYEVKLLVAE